MKLLIEADFMRVTAIGHHDCHITVLSISVLQAWQILQQEKTRQKLAHKKGYRVTYIDRKAEQNSTPVFLLQYKKNPFTNEETIWIQSLDRVPDNYVNLHMKMAV
ncbi:MAG: hypothetical protein KF862_26835 [Chitinophagaceae bacterium]|nr:hypothetical protein [Chitinophagaceae bacterium]